MLIFSFASYPGSRGVPARGIPTTKPQQSEKATGRNPLSSRASPPSIGDKFGESLEGSQVPPSFWEVPGLPQKFPELPQNFFGDFPGSSLTVELNSNPEVPRKFPGLPRKFPKLPRKFPDFPGGQPLSLGSLTPSPDSQKLSLIQKDFHGAKRPCRKGGGGSGSKRGREGVRVPIGVPGRGASGSGPGGWFCCEE